MGGRRPLQQVVDTAKLHVFVLLLAVHGVAHSGRGGGHAVLDGLLLHQSVWSKEHSPVTLPHRRGGVGERVM
jgi:hypothetical protein